MGKRAKGTVPDWNAIHDKQIFSRQPDLATYDKEKKERQQKIFGSNKKMSTPGLKKRSKSAMGKRTHGNTHGSEKKRDRKKAIQMVPSSNDHKFNSNTDSKVNRKSNRKPTPFAKDMKSSSVNARNKKMVSRKPVFDAIDESAADDAISEVKEEKIEKMEAAKKTKNKLAFDPNKVSSRLFQSTSSSNNKMRKLDTGKSEETCRNSTSSQ